MATPPIPRFYDMPFTQEGKLTPQDKIKLTGQAKIYNDNLSTSLNSLHKLTNTYISNDGISFPNKTTAEITSLQPAAALGTIWFNTTISKLQVKTAPGIVETISSS